MKVSWARNIDLIISLSLFSDIDLAHIAGDAEREDARVQGRGPQGARAPRRLLQVCALLYINSYPVSVCITQACACSRRNQLSSVCVSVVCVSIPNIYFCIYLSSSVSVPVSFWSYGCVLVYIHVLFPMSDILFNHQKKFICPKKQIWQPKTRSLKIFRILEVFTFVESTWGVS